MRLEGVYVATITPFQGNQAGGTVDWKGLENHLEFLVKAGVHGFVPTGTTGEGSTLTAEERKQITHLTVEAAKPKGLKVVAGCGSNSTKAVLDNIADAQSEGADAALVVTPYYNKPTVSGVKAHYRFLADKSALPIVLYNVPSRTNVCLSVDTVRELLAHPNIIGIKEASGRHDLWMSLSQSIDWKTKSFLAGDDDAFALIRMLGGSGIISASANVIPDLFVKIYDLTKKKDWEGAFNLQKEILPLVNSLFVETNPAPAKFALKVLRNLGEELRLPLVKVSRESQELIRGRLQALGLIR